MFPQKVDGDLKTPGERGLPVRLAVRAVGPAEGWEVPPVSPRLYMIHQLNFGVCNQNKI